MSVIDPQTWADAEDGRALRELRGALPEGHDLTVSYTWMARGGPVQIDLWRHGYPGVAMQWQEASLREAADAARAALVKR